MVEAKDRQMDSLFDFGDGRGPSPAHRHPNGGGWVDDTAKVNDTAYVHEDATIGGSATIGRLASIGESACVGGSASIGRSACIGEFATVGGSACIGEFATVGGSACIGEFATIGRLATIGRFASIGRLASIGESATVGGSAPIVPVIPNLDAAVLAAVEKEGCRLDMSAWHGSSSIGHRCQTSHCRAGWAIHLAGEQGYALEAFYGAWLAGVLLYRAAYPKRRIPDFFASNEATLADIRECAAASQN